MTNKKLKAESFDPRLFIEHKKIGKEHAEHEIYSFIQGVTSKKIPEYQTTAWLMAAYLQGLTVKEVAHLTQAMLHSGTVLSSFGPTCIDKHSTGGVGDKTSLVIAPLAAAAGVTVPMIAGRGLGHTGGTVDKMEAIPGFKTELPLKTFTELLKTQKLALIGQTSEIAPADKVIYSLRDVTSTVDHLGLITASIMSKKLAEGAEGFVLDVKWGNGALMTKVKEAKALAKSLVQTAKQCGKRAMAFITDMNEPLGTHLGHRLEVIECIDLLHNRPSDHNLRELCLVLTGAMIYLANLAPSLKAGRKKAEQVLLSGAGLNYFKQMLSAQGADPNIVDNYDLMPSAPCQYTVCASAKMKGRVQLIQTRQLGETLIKLGAGRVTREDHIDHAVGIIMHVKRGDKIKPKQPLLTFHYQPFQEALIKQLEKLVREELIIVSEKKSFLTHLLKRSSKKIFWESRS